MGFLHIFAKKSIQTFFKTTYFESTRVGLSNGGAKIIKVVIFPRIKKIFFFGNMTTFGQN
jgi:hypothetical protein